MKILVNGNVQEVKASEATISEILKQNNVTKPEMVSVQLNEHFVEPGRYESAQLNENDEVEFIYFMGGGACSLKGELASSRKKKEKPHSLSINV